MTKEEIMALDVDALETRTAEIRELSKADDADCAGLLEELDIIAERKAAIKEQAEQRAALAAKVADGKVGEVIKTDFMEVKPMEERTYTADDAEYRIAYLKNLQGTATVEQRTMVAAVSAIPTTTVNEIYGKMAENPLYDALNKLNIPGYVTVPVASTINDASWVDMDVASTDSADAVTSVALSAYKLIKTLEIGADIKAMAVPAFEAWLTDTLARKMVAAICNAVINGTGSSQPTGVLTAKAAETVTAIDYKAILDLMGGVPSQYHQNAVFVTNAATLFGTIYNLVDSQKHPILVVNVAEGGGYLLMGHKVILDESMAGTALMFGDFTNGYVLNLGAGITIKSDESVGFRTGSTVYRGMALVDGKVAVTAAFKTIKI